MTEQFVPNTTNSTLVILFEHEGGVEVLELPIVAWAISQMKDWQAEPISLYERGTRERWLIKHGDLYTCVELEVTYDSLHDAVEAYRATLAQDRVAK
jgi:hypothetical protein